MKFLFFSLSIFCFLLMAKEPHIVCRNWSSGISIEGEEGCQQIFKIAKNECPAQSVSPDRVTTGRGRKREFQVKFDIPNHGSASAFFSCSRAGKTEFRSFYLTRTNGEKFAFSARSEISNIILPGDDMKYVKCSAEDDDDLKRIKNLICK